MDSVAISRVEMAEESITESSGPGSNSIAQNPNHVDFLRNKIDTHRAFSRTDFNISNDEARNNRTIEHGAFPASRSKYNQQTHTHRNGEKKFLSSLLFKILLQHFFFPL